jgi:hypothetical protein
MRNEGFVDIDFRGSQSHNSIRIAIASESMTNGAFVFGAMMHPMTWK